MSQTARASVAEFRPMLSPPVRVSLRTLQSFCRPQCQPSPTTRGLPPQCLTQRRNLQLYKTATAETVLGMHKVLPFTQYSLPPLNSSTHLVNLAKGGEMLAQISLQDVYKNHVMPGQLLYLNEEISKRKAESLEVKNDVALGKHRTFGIFEAESIPGNKKDARQGKGIGALRVTPIMLSSPAHYFKHAIDRSYQFIKHGSPVEFTMRFRGAHAKKEEKLLPVGHELWHWIHEHFPHIRPDFILRSMPEGSRFIIEPVTDGRVLQFVIGTDKARHNGPFRKDLTERLFKVKASVTMSVEQGKQAQLPKYYRDQLQRAGNKAYSPMTGLPIEKKGEVDAMDMDTDTDTTVDRYLPKDTTGDRHLPKDTTGDRYLPKDPPRNPVRVDKLSKDGTLLGPRLMREYGKCTGEDEGLEKTVHTGI
ncbi:hypothetical protein HBI56_132140 [Parastagonospora nodorum]|nr:hypothetical protein HBH53_218980 [Parastagonospora nodorum]KAH3970464.1 hypothetical protein HBH52_164840 [Parastagonospora nodorum]KAH3996769.1 hypothetical protein HBI10_154060 [Parastagonospora nodorum]KAH4012626.1 hypothetical protein HBI13_188750 [Parastagonospora nodorum]KAH4150921.1 hypothetical protein HBH43_244880 [Parastagonospora nodorum]